MANLFYQLDQQVLQLTENLNASALFAYLENKYNYYKPKGKLVNGGFWLQYKDVKASLFIGEDAIRSALKVLVSKGLLTAETKRTAKGSSVIITINTAILNDLRDTLNVRDTKSNREEEKAVEAIKNAENVDAETAKEINKVNNQTLTNMRIANTKSKIKNTEFILKCKKHLKEGKEYSNAELKEILTNVANELGLNATVPATGIEEIANVTKLDTRRDGKKFKGYAINSFKAIVVNNTDFTL